MSAFHFIQEFVKYCTPYLIVSSLISIKWIISQLARLQWMYHETKLNQNIQQVLLLLRAHSLACIIYSMSSICAKLAPVSRMRLILFYIAYLFNWYSFDCLAAAKIATRDLHGYNWYFVVVRMLFIFDSIQVIWILVLSVCTYFKTDPIRCSSRKSEDRFFKCH